MPKKCQIDHIELPCDRLPRAFDGITILHISDMHITRWSRSLELWREAFARVQPDLVAITGDLGHRSWLWRTSLPNIRKLLEPLSPRLGMYFILGNHDSIKLGPALVESATGSPSAPVLLRNESVILSADNGKISVELPIAASPRAPVAASSPSSTRLAIIGIHQHRRIDTDIPQALRNVLPTDFKLMLLHYPDLVHPAAAAGADVCLAGHTHGGQICWPDGTPLFRHDTLARAQTTGIHRVNGTWIIVNRGIGSAGLKMRLFCPPQSVMITLRATAKNS